MLVLESRLTPLSPPLRFVRDALVRPGEHPRNFGYAWPVTLEGTQLPRIVEDDTPDRVVWSSPWRQAPRILIQFDLTDDGGGGTLLRWTLLTPTPAPSIATINQLRELTSRLVNIDLRRSLTH